jgi:hypothetical protein
VAQLRRLQRSRRLSTAWFVSLGALVAAASCVLWRRTRVVCCCRRSGAAVHRHDSRWIHGRPDAVHVADWLQGTGLSWASCSVVTPSPTPGACLRQAIMDVVTSSPEAEEMFGTPITRVSAVAAEACACATSARAMVVWWCTFCSAGMGLGRSDSAHDHIC